MKYTEEEKKAINDLKYLLKRRYEDENGFDYNWRISISRLFNKELWIEIINNDCSYHNEGPDIEELFNKIYDLIQAGLVEKV